MGGAGRDLCCGKERQPAAFQTFILVLTPQENKKSVTLVYVKSEQHDHGKNLRPGVETDTSVLQACNALHTTVRLSGVCRLFEKCFIFVIIRSQN